MYDITQEYYQVIEERTSSKNSNSVTAYDYGLERIAAHSSGEKTSYVYDGRGSVAQTITVPEPGEKTKAALPDALTNNTVSGNALGAPVLPQIQSFAYTAFGEQMGSAKVSGFGYNAEYYDAATGMQNLRARQYEPDMGRFSQKDILRGSAATPLSLNRYVYVLNNPMNMVDPSGKITLTMSDSKNTVKAKGTTVMEALKDGMRQLQALSNADSAAGTAKKVAKAANSGFNSPITRELAKTNSKVKDALADAQKEIEAKQKALGRNLSVAEMDAIFARSCAKVTDNYKDYWNSNSTNKADDAIVQAAMDKAEKAKETVGQLNEYDLAYYEPLTNMDDLIKKYGLESYDHKADLTIEIPLLGTIKVNAAEYVIYHENPFLSAQGYLTSQAANKVTEKYFGDRWKTDDTDANAFRHAFWNTKLTLAVGAENAKIVTDAHEYKQLEANWAANAEMDLHNNFGGGKSDKNCKLKQI